MKVKVNGDEKEFSQDTLSIASLLSESKVQNPDMVSVQLNGEFVEKDEYDNKNVSENDDVEFLYFMGGGSQ